MSGYVYLIGSKVFGWYKIGKSKQPVVRVSDLGILLPFKVEVFGVWRAKNHSLLESTLHEIYDNKKINGEWFEFTREEAVKVFLSLPEEARIYPTEDKQHALDRFSNIIEDTRKEKRVIGVRTQKLRGDFTPEEREQKRIESMAQQELKKKAKQVMSDDKVKIPRSITPLHQNLVTALTILD